MRLETARWLASADEDWEVATLLLSAGHNSACVFHTHLSLEKMLKALITASADGKAPYTHSLTRLAALTGFEIDDNVMALLGLLAPHGVDARYDNDFQGYSDGFCGVLLTEAGNARAWLRRLLS